MFVSTNVRPVTVTADVAVKKATTVGVNPSAVFANGNDKRMPPTNIKVIKLYKSMKGEANSLEG